MKIISGAGEFTAPSAGEGVTWVEHLRVPDLSVGTYSTRPAARMSSHRILRTRFTW